MRDSERETRRAEEMDQTSLSIFDRFFGCKWDRETGRDNEFERPTGVTEKRKHEGKDKVIGGKVKEFDPCLNSSCVFFMLLNPLLVSIIFQCILSIQGWSHEEWNGWNPGSFPPSSLTKWHSIRFYWRKHEVMHSQEKPSPHPSFTCLSVQMSFLPQHDF